MTFPIIQQIPHGYGLASIQSPNGQWLGMVCRSGLTSIQTTADDWHFPGMRPRLQPMQCAMKCILGKTCPEQLNKLSQWCTWDNLGVSNCRWSPKCQLKLRVTRNHGSCNPKVWDFYITGGIITNQATAAQHAARPASVSMASLPTCAEWGNGREYCADSRPAAKLDRLKMGDRCLGPMLGTMLEMLVAKQPPRTHRGNTQLLPTWRITTGCYWLFQLNQPYKLGISWFIHPYGWVATRCFNNLLVLIFSVYHCIHQFRSSGHPRSVTTRSSSRLGPQPQDVPTPLVLPSASEAPAQLTWSDVTWQNKHNIYIYIIVYIYIFFFDGLSKCLLVWLINRNTLCAVSCLVFKIMTYLNSRTPCILYFMFEAVAKTCSKC